MPLQRVLYDEAQKLPAAGAGSKRVALKDAIHFLADCFLLFFAAHCNIAPFRKRACPVEFHLDSSASLQA
jgi:hypothetical protein